MIKFEPRVMWPDGLPRTEKPKPSKFSDKALHDVLNSLRKELALVKAAEITLCSELPLGRSGVPIQGWKRGDDPGVVLYYTAGGRKLCIPADHWDYPLCNIHAITKTIEALRGIERWAGGAMAGMVAFQFAALPAAATPWWMTELDLGPEATLADAEESFVKLTKIHHPDLTGRGDGSKQARLNEAIAEARKVLE